MKKVWTRIIAGYRMFTQDIKTAERWKNDGEEGEEYIKVEAHVVLKVKKGDVEETFTIYGTAEACAQVIAMNQALIAAKAQLNTAIA